MVYRRVIPEFIEGPQDVTSKDVKNARGLVFPHVIRMLVLTSSELELSLLNRSFSILKPIIQVFVFRYI